MLLFGGTGRMFRAYTVDARSEAVDANFPKLF
jgi:hypothetical protein